MRRTITSYLSSAATFAKADDAGQPEKAEKGQAVVYLNGDDTLREVIVQCENAAAANLSFCASMTVHLIARCYTPILRDRVKVDDVKTEILNAVREHGAAKRGKEFGRAWSYRILSLAMTMGRSLMTDYAKKGVIEGSPLHDVLRAKNAAKGIEIVLGYMTAKTKGDNSLKVLEKALEPAKAKQNGKGKTGQKKGAKKGQASNNQRPVTTAATAKAIMGAHAEEVFQAVPAKSAKDRANKLADKVGAANNVDHAAFILRSLTFVNDADKLMAIAEKATELAKAIQAKANENADAGKPEKAVAEAG